MNRIDNVKSLFLTTILFLLVLNGCQISSIPPSLEQQSASPLTQGTLPNQPIRIITPSPINDQIDEESTGPGLLIKDDTNPDQLLWLLDISTQKIEPFTLPPDLTITSLSKGASPDKSNFVLTNLPSASLANHSLYIFNYQKKEIQVEIQLSPIEPVDFSKIYDSLADEIRTLMLDRNYGIWMLKESAANSMNSFHWAHDGNSVYHAETGLDGYTYLFQYDLITRKNNQLESQPYFLEAVKPSPDNSSLLVIKSLLTQVFDFPIKSAFVITENNELIQLPIPEQQEGEIIELSWFDSDNILISIFNSLEFSYTQLGYFNLLDQQYREMTTSHFQNLIQLNEKVILISPDIQKGIFKLDIYSLENFVQTLKLNDNCTQVDLSPLPCCKLIVKCEQNSYSLDNNFSIKLLPEIQGKLFFSPNNKFIISDQTNSSDDLQSLLTLMNADFSPIREYPASSIRQVIWQPDSQGFLYLTLEGLNYVSLPNGEPTRVYEFNTDDYRYLDFIWIVP